VSHATTRQLPRLEIKLKGAAWRCLALLGVTRGGKMLLEFIGIITGFPVFCLLKGKIRLF
jgi:hypothetical protein